MKSVSAIALITLCACSRPPIEWGPVVREGAPPEPREFPGPLAASPTRNVCPGSLRIANDEYAVWWEVRRDSTVLLKTARASGPNTWNPAVTVDSTDSGVRGCGRPPPAIAADSASGYVHVAWWSEPASGAGVFFAHSMDNGATFHAAVPILFGRNPSRVSITSNGDLVVVAYEDPNATQPLIGVAISNTMGHIFENRSVASSENGRARQPVVRIAGDSIRLWWSEYSPIPTVSATRPFYRAGVWRRAN